ncbi:putative adipose-regulatory protein-domain-containing protein [Whalleya microplaca]|nr:putative adipose-regulatory protein-domain-containing protein [Whalleya microplaca]
MDELAVDDGWATTAPFQHDVYRARRGSGSGSSAAKSSVGLDVPLPHANNVNINNLNAAGGRRPLVIPTNFVLSSRQGAEPNGAPASSRKMEYIKTPYRVATSPAAKRTYLGAFLFVATSLALLVIAALAYPVFYYNYVPKKVISVPVHLQYNSGPNPFGVTSLSSSLMYEQAYDVSVELTLPRSPPNLAKGNFMVALFALKYLPTPDSPASSGSTSFSSVPYFAAEPPHAHIRKDNVVFMSRRPTLIPYADPVVAAASRALFLLWHVAYPDAAETTTLVVPMGQLVEFADALPLSLLLDVEAGQGLQVYGASVTLVARLTGVRWAMYNHRILSFVVCTGVFWACEMLFTGVAWVVLGYVIFGSRDDKLVMGRRRRNREAWRVQGEGENTDEGEVPTGYEGGSALKQEGEDVKVKEESTETETLAEYPRHAGDADDEGDGEDAWRGSGAGSSFDDGKGGSLRRRPSREVSSS